MKVNLNTARAFLDDKGFGVSQKAGEEIEVDDDEANRLIESGQATPVKKVTKKKAPKKAE